MTKKKRIDNGGGATPPPTTTAREKMVAAGFRKWDGEFPKFPDLTTDDAKRRIAEALTRYQSGDDTSNDAGWVDAGRIMAFCDHVFDGSPIDDRVLSDLATNLYFILKGAPWETRFVLPGRAPRDDYSSIHPRDWREMSMYVYAQNLIDETEMKVTDAIDLSAKRNHVSYETARAAYYKWKKQF